MTEELTTEEARIALAGALLNKISRLNWLAKYDRTRSEVGEVELTEAEKTEALMKAVKDKAFVADMERIKIQERDKAKKEAAELVAKWNYGHFYRMMKDEAWKQGIELIFNDQTQTLIKTICFKLANDKRYETDLNFSFSKGLMLRGEPGLGKTWILGLVAANPIMPVQMLTMNEISRSVAETGKFEGLRFATYKLVYLDDVGTEGNEVTYYGTKINWFKTWFEELYAKNKTAFNRVIISTNCSFDDLEKLYGFRVRDRMAEMFDVLDLTGKSLRRK